MSAGVWHAYLTPRHRRVDVSLPTPLILNAEERGWVEARSLPSVANMMYTADILLDPVVRSVRRLPWQPPMHDADVSGAELVPDRLNYSYDV